MVRTSIVIPTHNRAEMLRDAIESALALPGASARELIVVNDGSTDATDAVLRGYGRRIRALSVSHGERSRARNAGLAAATGDFVVFLDDDDVFLPEGLERLEAELEKSSSDVAMVYGKPRYVKVDPDSPLAGTLPPQLGASGWILPQLLCNNFLVVGNLVARREVLQALGGFDSAWPPVEDYELWVRVAAGKRIVYCDVESAEIRLHRSNSTTAMDRSFQKSEGVREGYLLSPRCLQDAASRDAAGQPAAREALAHVILDLARQRWWQGDVATSRRAFSQAVRLAPMQTLRGAGELWRLWLPRRRYASLSASENASS